MAYMDYNVLNFKKKGFTNEYWHLKKIVMKVYSYIRILTI